MEGSRSRLWRDHGGGNHCSSTSSFLLLPFRYVAPGPAPQHGRARSLLLEGCRGAGPQAVQGGREGEAGAGEEGGRCRRKWSVEDDQEGTERGEQLFLFVSCFFLALFALRARVLGFRFRFFFLSSCFFSREKKIKPEK